MIATRVRRTSGIGVVAVIAALGLVATLADPFRPRRILN